MKHSFFPVFLILVAGCNADPSSSKTVPPPLAIHSTRPALEILAGDGLLGSADFGESRTCRFRIRNNQSKPASLQLLEKSCTCANVQLPTTPLAPGQETDVILVWIPKVEAVETSRVRLLAEVGDTNSQSRVKLEATGTIEPRLSVAFPRGPLNLGKLSLSDLEQDRMKMVTEVYSRQQTFVTPKVTSSMPGLEVLSTESLTADRLAALQARSGYRITIKPTRELPHGVFLAQVSITTEIKPIPLVLDITGHLETAAISLSQDKVQLPPRLAISSGYRVPAITLTIRYGNCRQGEIARITPDIFDARLQQLNDKSWRLEMNLAQDLTQRLSSESLQQLLDSGFDQGSITLKFDHPDVKTLTIPINGCQFTKD